MRLFFATALFLACCIAQPAKAQTVSYAVGITRITIPANEPFDALVWYPASEHGVPWQLGPFPIPAAKDAPVAEGTFPMVLLSHGGGKSGGSPLILRELSSNLAGSGFIVVAPFHGKTPFLKRGFQMTFAGAAVRSDPRFSANIAPGKLALVGFSLGSAVALTLAGAIPDNKQLASYCQAHPKDRLSCSGGPTAKKPQNNSPSGPTPSRKQVLPRIPSAQALVLLDPFSVLFRPESLAKIDPHTLVFRPADSALGEANLEVLTANLGASLKTHTVPGGHFVFADNCPQLLADDAPLICKDAPGIERSKVHGIVELETASFLKKQLR